MSKLALLYSDTVKKHFKILYANWEPGAPIELGDYGVLEGNIFIPIGKLKDDFKEFSDGFVKIMPDSTKDVKEFKSESGVKVAVYSKGSLSPQGVELVKATLDISFSEKDSIYFNASGCTTSRISNKAKVGEKIMELMKQGKWQKKFCIVTDLITADRAIIAISQSSSSNISFEADSPAVEKINLADASIKLSLNTETDIGYKIPAEEGLVLLLGLCKIKNPFLWWGGDFNQKTLLTDAMKFEIENTSEILTEKSVDELIFGQLGMD